MITMKCCKKLNVQLIRNSNLSQLRFFHYKPDCIVIAAAARTPWGKYQGQLSSLSSWQLGQIAVESAVKQSAIPLEQIQQIFMNEAPRMQRDNKSEFIFSNLLKKTKYTAINIEDYEGWKIVALQNAVEFLKGKQQTAVVVGGLESATQNQRLEITQSHTDPLTEVSSDVANNYIAKMKDRYSDSYREMVFDSQIVPLTVKQESKNRRIIKEITHDEISSENYRKAKGSFQYSDGAASLVLTTFANAQELDLSPLAVIIDFEYLSNSNSLYPNKECLEKLFSKINLDPHQIAHWEIEDITLQPVDFFKCAFNLNFDLINPHGGSAILGHSSAASLARLTTHLAHSLSPYEYGCVICCSLLESVGLVIQKLPLPLISERLPLITLYTKDPCPLCDSLVEELELNFAGEYDLKKVFINTKDNIRFLRLYRLDIPVVFLNNQFLCMHRLNHRLLRKRLNILNK